MLDFTQTLWLDDTLNALRTLLLESTAQNAIMAFLKAEYNEQQLELYLAVNKMDALRDPKKIEKEAQTLYAKYFAAGKGQGIGAQQRTKATQALWDAANNSSGSAVDPNVAYNKLKEEGEIALKLMALDAFPRFIKTPAAEQLMAQLVKKGGQGASLAGALTQGGPQDADDWLNSFVVTAETFPACIVISDMTIPGAPMVFVNTEFCRVTGYEKDEATGRNCRFLQGPDTEPEAIQVIRNTLSKGQECHVKLTNYRKNGEKFQNLLSMKPVFDLDNIYRYVIGVQFEIKDDSNLKARLVQLDKLLRLLPSKLNLRSKASARAKGVMAVKTSGEANQLVTNKEQILEQARDAERQENAQGSSRPRSLVQMSQYDASRLNYDRTICAFTKVMWLQDPVTACRGVLIDPLGREFFTNFAESSCSSLVQFHLKFWDQALQIRAAQGQTQLRKMRFLHMRKKQNPLFYCSTTEIEYGTLNSVNWAPIFQNMCLWHEQSTMMLAQEAFLRFLEHPSSTELIAKLALRERAGEQLSCRTAAFGVKPDSPTMWLDLFKNMAESCSVGVVVSDMTVPGIPLVYINEGFKTVTGYGKEKIGCSCRFLQGPETEVYVNDEIMEALQQSMPALFKLHNYKANGQKFQCLFALHPVFGPSGEYKFQIGIQIDMVAQPTITAQLLELERILRYLPRTMTGADSEDAVRVLPSDVMGDQTIMPYVNIDPSTTMGAAPAAAAPSGGGGMGGGMGGGFGTPAPSAGGFGGGGGMGGMGGDAMGGFSPAPPSGGAPSFSSPRAGGGFGDSSGGFGGGGGGIGGGGGGGW